LGGNRHGAVVPIQCRGAAVEATTPRRLGSHSPPANAVQRRWFLIFGISTRPSITTIKSIAPVGTIRAVCDHIAPRSPPSEPSTIKGPTKGRASCQHFYLYYRPLDVGGVGVGVMPAQCVDSVENRSRYRGRKVGSMRHRQVLTDPKER
jgi:hypothetical protein